MNSNKEMVNNSGIAEAISFFYLYILGFLKSIVSMDVLQYK